MGLSHGFGFSAKQTLKHAGCFGLGRGCSWESSAGNVAVTGHMRRGVWSVYFWGDRSRQLRFVFTLTRSPLPTVPPLRGLPRGGCEPPLGAIGGHRALQILKSQACGQPGPCSLEAIHLDQIQSAKPPTSQVQLVRVSTGAYSAELHQLQPMGCSPGCLHPKPLDRELVSI